MEALMLLRFAFTLASSPPPRSAYSHFMQCNHAWASDLMGMESCTKSSCEGSTGEPPLPGLFLYSLLSHSQTICDTNLTNLRTLLNLKSEEILFVTRYFHLIRGTSVKTLGRSIVMSSPGGACLSDD